jgi:hypothetical protein
MKFEVLAAVKMPMIVFWAVTPFGLADGYQRGTYCIHLQGWTGLIWLRIGTYGGLS